MNILLINHYAGSPELGMEYRPYYLSHEWQKLGHRVSVVAASQSHVRSRPVRLNGKRSNERIDGIHYTWLATPKYMGNGVGRVRNMAAFVWRLFRESNALVKEIGPDVVIASSTYPMDIWPAHRLSRRCGAKLIFEVHDLWPLSPMELGKMSRRHPFIMVVQAAEDYAYAHADAVVSLLPKAKDYMISRGMHHDKFHYIPNGIDSGEWSQNAELPGDVAQVMVRLRKKGRPLLGYAGAHGLANALDVLFDAAALLSGVAEIVTIGAGSESERLKQRVQRENLENVTMIPALTKKYMPAFLEAIDIAYIGLQKSVLFHYGISPNKLMDYMMAAKPVVQAVDTGNDLVSESNCGITVPPGDAAAVRDAVLRLAALSPDELTVLGQNGRAFIMQEQTYEVLAAKFVAVIGSLSI